MIVEYIFLWTSLALIICIVIASIRLVAGPTPPDRAVALDTINTLVVASMLSLGVAYFEPLFIDIAIVYALLSFISTLYIARIIEEKEVAK